VCSGRVVRECHAQVPLIDLLCDYGADPQQAIWAALVHAEFEAVDALIRRGAQVDLAVAAAMGFIEDARRLVASADNECRHRALALASQFGCTEIVRLLLDSGEDPNRYNPVGFHSHSTPLHQAVLAGHEATVTLLVESGAALDARDTLWQGTPADWARYGKRMNIEEYLLAQQERSNDESGKTCDNRIMDGHSLDT
jgi:Ankyrin repeats (3 copies)